MACEETGFSFLFDYADDIYALTGYSFCGHWRIRCYFDFMRFSSEK